MNSDKLSSLRIDSSVKKRSTGVVWLILLTVLAAVIVTLFLAWPRADDNRRPSEGTLAAKPQPAKTELAASTKSPAKAAEKPPATTTASSKPAVDPASPADAILTTSGYIINRERIEISPRFMGLVRWIGVKKGDHVTNNQVVVRLDDIDYQTQLAQSEARLAMSKVNLERAELNYKRVKTLKQSNVESQQMEDDMRLSVDSAKASILEMEAQIRQLTNYISWTVIRSPIDGVVLEKLVDPNEMVTPQSFGGSRGPSTALIAVADPKDLQVEIDLNEADVAKVFLNQKCRVTPEAYPDKHYVGYVAEKAPEANRQKGTLQLKVQIVDPDGFLTPELSATVDFYKDTYQH